MKLLQEKKKKWAKYLIENSEEKRPWILQRDKLMKPKLRARSK